MTFITDTRPAARATARANARANAPRFGFADMIAVWRQRQQLKALDAAQLDDIGLTRRDAVTEASRPIWDVPTTWRD